MGTGIPLQVPEKASVVIIGGGVIGLSTAFHLAAAGISDVTLVERDTFGAGSTSKAAGGVRAQFSDRTNIQLALRSLHAYERFRQDIGQDIDLHQPGYLFLLDSDDDVDIFRRSIALQNSLGVPSRLIDIDEALSLSPLITTSGLRGAAYSPTDGYCTPEAVVLGYATAARRLGARLVRGVAATGLDTDDVGITAVVTTAGRIRTSTVVCAAGAWSREVGLWAGVELPVTPIRRQVALLRHTCSVPPSAFTVELSSSYYFHPEGNGLLVGISHPDEPAGFHVATDDRWLDQLTRAIERRTPRLVDAEITGGWAGLYEVTPDHNAVVGESTETSRFLYATGFSGHGFLMAPAIGEVLRDLYLGRVPLIDISSLDVTRFARAVPVDERNII